MKNNLIYPFCALMLLIISCDKDSDGTTTDSTQSIPQRISIYYSDDNGKSFPGAYEAVRIGEYYWMNNNFNHNKEIDVTREQVDKVMRIYNLNPADFKIKKADFEKYYGQYYSRRFIEDMATYGRMYEGKERTYKRDWGMPSRADFRQLFAMCGDGTEPAVRTFLTCKASENPVAQDIPNTYWFGPLNRNRYGFNMLPGGARFHSKDTWNPHNAPTPIEADAHDFYGFYEAVIFPCSDPGTVKIHDYVETDGPKLWHLMPMRWCRRLTDEELGYKLYINADKTDIVKKSLTEAAPSGYSELARGAVRGFYVQYILDNPHPEKTVADIVKLAAAMR